jgi:hypothetical protein
VEKTPLQSVPVKVYGTTDVITVAAPILVVALPVAKRTRAVSRRLDPVAPTRGERVADTEDPTTRALTGPACMTNARGMRLTPLARRG